MGSESHAATARKDYGGMFENFRSLTPKGKRHIIIAMLILVIPVSVYALAGSIHMYENKISATEKYDDRMEISPEKMAEFEIPKAAYPVKVGLYMESISDVSVAANSWKAKFLLWFSWEGDHWTPEEYPGENFIIGNGHQTDKTLLEEYHENGVHYQQYRIFATIEKYFDTTRYPLDSHQLKIFIESDKDMSEVYYLADTENSGTSPYLSIAGFDILNIDVGLYLNEYSSSMGQPVLTEKGFDGKKTFEYVFVTRVNRAGYSLFLKAFLSLLSILLWVCISLYNCAYNQNDAMGAINTGIFGVVSSMIVGMNLLSDARGGGLIEYINFFSLAMILIITVYVIRINRFRAKNVSEAFVTSYAKSLFWCASALSVVSIAMFVLSAGFF